MNLGGNTIRYADSKKLWDEIRPIEFVFLVSLGPLPLPFRVCYPLRLQLLLQLLALVLGVKLLLNLFSFLIGIGHFHLSTP